MIEGTDRFKATEGTIYFYAPEQCNSKGGDFAGRPLDIWALGVTLYIMLYQKLPFYPKTEGNMIELLDLIAEGKYEIDDNKRKVSPELKLLLTRMLEKDALKRITAEDLKKDKWINENREDLSNIKHEKVVVTEEEIKDSLKFFFIIQKTVIFNFILFN
jgi:serine/threonine protein kinase